MSASSDNEGIERALRGLRDHGVVPAVAAPLEATAGSVARTLRERICTDIDAFSSSANPELVPDLERHLDELLADVCRLLGGGRCGDFAFVRGHAQRRAEQRFPLEASLHAYRCCHRIVAGWIRDAALPVAEAAAQVRRVVAAAADFAIEYFDTISTIATAEYVAHTRLLAEAAGDQRTELLRVLLSGYDEADSRAAGLLRRAGYLEQRQSFCVAVARSVDPREMENTARAQRMAEAVGQVLRHAPVRSLIGLRDGLVTIVLSGTRRLSGWTAPQSLLADRVYDKLLEVGPAALIGLSNDAPSTSHIRRAHDEARLALDFASVSQRVMPCSRIPFRQLIIRHARDNARLAPPAWLAGLKAADRKAKNALGKTLQAYADANMNALQAAKNLSIHPNTVYSRMQKIAEVTGRNALTYNDLTELLLAIDSDAGHCGN
ncbi:MAG TPA: helix-turn-helix domain-containing protein [Woeseiaceae bacterium]|nr:helix-turn-helix domain-containing protein [Woeseiaceae bacterium]